MGQWYNNASQAERDALENAMRGLGAGTIQAAEAISNSSATAFVVGTSGASGTSGTLPATITVNTTASGVAAFGVNSNGLTGLYAATSGATGAVVAAALSTGPALIAIGSSGAVSATLGPAVQATFAANVAGASVAPLNVVASTASQAVISISGVFISTASINLAANKTAFIIPVYHETQRVFGYVAASIGPS